MRNLVLFGIAVATASLATCVPISSARAQQDLTWDVNGATTGTGGTGTWDTTSPFWFNGATFQTWNNATFDNAIFAGSAGNVTLGTPISVHNLTFNVSGYLFPSLGTFALTFGGVNPTITTHVGTTQFFFPLTGSTGFTKSGTGTLQLGGTGIGYTGVTTVDAGTLAVSNSLALGFGTAASNLVLNNGSTIAFSSPSFNHNYTLTGGIVNLQMTGINNLVSGSPTLTASTTLNLNGTGTTGTLSGNLADTGVNILSVTKSNTGRVILSGNNSYTGPTTVTRGRLQLNSAGALSSGSNLVFNGAVGTGGSIELTSNFGNFTRGLGAGAGQVQWLGDGGFLSSGSDRSVNIGGAGAMLTWGVGGFVPDGNRLILGTSSSHLLDFQNGIDLSGGVRAVQGDGGLISGHARMSGILSGTGGINQVGNGFLELTGANTYTGGTVMSSGTVVVGSDANLGNASGTLTFNGGTLENTSAFTTARSVTINALGGTFRTDANLEASGAITGAGQLTKVGAATLSLTGDNAYLGGTTINAGTLQIGNGGATGSILGDVTNNGVLAFNRSNALTFGGGISGSGSLEQRGDGTLMLTGTNTYTGGTTISAGTLQTGVANALSTSTAVTVASGANFDLDSFNQSIGSLTGAGNVALGSATLTTGNDGSSTTFSGVMSGTGGLVKVGPGTFIFLNDNVYSGGTTINAGTLQLGNGGTSGSIVGPVTNNGTLTVQRSNTLTLSSNISGSGVFQQNGTGTTILAGLNSYSGATSVNSGTLLVNGSIVNSSVTVNAGATIGGNGSVGPLLINGGTLSPGNSIGTINVQGNLTFTAASAYLVEIDPTTSDRTNVAGTATLGGASVSAIYGNGSYVARQYTILNASGGVVGTFNSLVNTNLPTNFTPSLRYDSNNAYLVLTLNFMPGPPTPPVPTPPVPSPPSAPTFHGLNQNQASVANALINSFNTAGGIPLVFGALTPDGLTQVSGEAATGTQQATFDAMDRFLNVITDPFIGLRAGNAQMGATGFADESDALGYAARRSGTTGSERDSYATIVGKVPLRAPALTPRWSTWAAGYGGTQSTDGNTVVGSQQPTNRIFGSASGVDYRISMDTFVGIAMGGAGTRYNLANGLGGGRSDMFQAGLYGRHHIGAAYMSAALAYGWQDITTDRSVFASQLRARFDANAISGRLEAGYRYLFGTGGLTPYAAGQFTTFWLPNHAEQVLAGANTFALSHAEKDVTASRSELGLRGDKSFAMADAIITLRGRAAWAHNFDTERSIMSFFQILPASAFVVNGAAPARDSALVSASAEARWLNGFSVAASFEGEFSKVTESYAGKGIVRYRW